MLVDELEIYAKAGDGGGGVVRWHRFKFKPKAGPAGGNGGRGGDVYVRAVRDLNVLSKYTGVKEFIAQNGGEGRSSSQHGLAGKDVFIDIPVGSRVTDVSNNRSVELLSEDETHKILSGGQGGFGNEHFKSSTNTSPEQWTEGKEGDEGRFKIELLLIAEVGLVGLPNAGKSSLLNTLTNARSRVGSYAFTTLEPHLGSFYGHLIADIPGLIEGASEGRGLGHKFLKHISRTKMLLHLVSLESEDPISDFLTVKKELAKSENSLIEKESWIIFTKNDLVDSDKINSVLENIDKNENRVFVVSLLTGEGVPELQNSLVKYLQER